MSEGLGIFRPTAGNGLSFCAKGKRNYEMHRKAPADFREVVESGMTVPMLRKRFCCSWRTLSRWFVETGTARRTTRPDARPVPSDFAEVGPTMYQKDLCEHYGAHASVVRRWLRLTGAKPKRYVTPKGTAPAPKATPVRRVTYGAHHQVKVDSTRDTSLEGLAAEHLRCATRAPVYRCTDRGRADPQGPLWRYGNVILSPADLFVRAHRHGFEARRFAA